MQNYAQTKTTLATKKGFNRPYFLLDAAKTPIGRLASEAAKILMGKNRADFSPDVDMGGMVIIINADQQVFTGKKAEKKVYFRYGRQLGSLKSRGYQEAKSLDFRFPIHIAIKRMLPKNRHQDLRINNRVLIVEGTNHGITAPITTIKLHTDNIYSELASTVSIAAAKPSTKVETKSDDLKKIEGIGPKIEELLHAAGILTFVNLAESTVETLNQILDDGGSKFNSHKATTASWSQQAELARDGKWDELKAWQDELNGGKEVK